MEKNEITISSIDGFKEFISKNDGAVTYFSTPQCNVCKVLKPKLKELVATNFPEMKFAYVNTIEAQKMAAQNQVFTVPTILFHLDGKECIRKSRNVNLKVLAEELKRPYEMMFGKTSNEI
ncbi:MAG: thioredoxin family protein [Melioribacteraceae bacterium]|nr:thioredoxin family protein [Melioribacteraceae bacterium]